MCFHDMFGYFMSLYYVLLLGICFSITYVILILELWVMFCSWVLHCFSLRCMNVLFFRACFVMSCSCTKLVFWDSFVMSSCCTMNYDKFLGMPKDNLYIGFSLLAQCWQIRNVHWNGKQSHRRLIETLVFDRNVEGLV